MSTIGIDCEKQKNEAKRRHRGGIIFQVLNIKNYNLSERYIKSRSLAGPV